MVVHPGEHQSGPAGLSTHRQIQTQSRANDNDRDTFSGKLTAFEYHTYPGFAAYSNISNTRSLNLKGGPPGAGDGDSYRGSGGRDRDRGKPLGRPGGASGANPPAPASNADTSDYQSSLPPSMPGPKAKGPSLGMRDRERTSVPGSTAYSREDSGQQQVGNMGPPGPRDGGGGNSAPFKGPGIVRRDTSTELNGISIPTTGSTTQYPVPDTPVSKITRNFQSDIDAPIEKGKDKKETTPNVKVAYEKPKPLTVATPASMTWRELQQALMYYTDAEWINYKKQKGEHADVEDFLRQCWIPAGSAAKTDPSERLYLDPVEVLGCLSSLNYEELVLPTLLHLIVGQARWNAGIKVDPVLKIPRWLVAPGQLSFTTGEQVHISFNKRGELLKYLMRSHSSLYKRPQLHSRTLPPLLFAIDKFKEIPVIPDNRFSANPYLQLFVREDPEESALQLEPYLETGASEEKQYEEFQVVAVEGEDDDEFGTQHIHTEPSPPMEAHSTPDPGWIHKLLPRICYPDDVGLECVVKLFPKLSPGRLAIRDGQGNTVLHIAARYRYVCDESEEATAKLLEVIKGLVEKYPDAVGELNEDSESPYLHRVRTYQKVMGVSRDMIPKDQITFYLKQLCISQYEPTQTLKLLYAADDERREQEPRFYLSLAGATFENKQFNRSQVESFLDTLALDNVLKFVKIVPFRIIEDTTPVSANPHSVHHHMKETHLGVDVDPTSATTSSTPEDLRPNNCELVFEFLKRTVGVRTIYEVAVEEANISDRSIPPHTNDAIIRCLKVMPKPPPGAPPAAPFSETITTWDWAKLDICSEVLLEVAPNVKTVYLYTSGNNAVLRSWSSVEGLIMFQNLTTVYLTVCKAHVLETTDAIRESIKKFKTRVKRLCETTVVNGKLRPMILVEVDDDALNEIDEQSRVLMSSFGDDFGVLSADKQESHEILQIPAWLKKMDAFTNYIIDCPNPVTNPIKVAILDDGFDMIDNERNYMKPSSIIFKTMDSWSSSLRRKKSKFLDRHPEVSYISESGHGTKMVKLIQKLCPKARLYVARLSNVSAGSGPTAESAAEAINWAVKCGVDVISMSWSIQMSPPSVAQPPPGESKLKTAIENAKKKNILMFGASSDEGNNGAIDPVIYPAAASGVFCIVAADYYGQLKPTVGAEREWNHVYAFPSEEVKDGKYHGSSVATALAAGFTALILHSAEISGYGVAENCDLRLLRKYENMAKVFNNLLVPKTRYVGVTYNIPDYVCKGDWDSVGKVALRGLLRRILGSAL